MKPFAKRVTTCYNMLYVIRTCARRPLYAHEQLHALYVYATLPTIPLLSNRRGVPAQAAYNYFYELVIMTCNHDIAYLVRNACNANARVQSGASLGTPVRPHVVTPIRITRKRECTCTIR